MKSTGIVRRVDELGRVVIPIELRNKFDIQVKDPIEIFVDGSSIVLKKYEPNCIFCGNSKKLVDYQGKLIPRYKIRTKRKVIEAIVAQMEQFAENGLDYNGKCYISQSACMDDAEAVAKLVESKFPKLNGKVLINNIGTTIGSHTGPGTVALFFWGDKRVD